VAVANAVRLELTGAMFVVTVVRAAKVATVVVVLLVVAYYVFSFTIGSDRHGSPLVPANRSAVPLRGTWCNGPSEPRQMRKITWALILWTALWIVANWALDPASTMTGEGIGHRAVPKPPTWVLFEIWAIGFVVLGAIWGKVFPGTRTGTASIEVPVDDRRTRRITWAILAWTVLWIVLFGIWASDPGQPFMSQGPGPGDPIRLKPPDWVLFDLWAIGIVVLGMIWLITRRRSERHRLS
jgi:hypothetical protein